MKKSLKLLEQAQEDGAAEAPRASDEIAARVLHASNELKSPAHLDKRNLHPYRLKVKELRYILQLSANSEDLQFVRKLGEVKDAIGEWHDWEELISIATGALDHGRECRLLPKLRQISEGKYHRALAVTNQMRRSIVSPESSKANSQTKRVAPVAVLTATSAITA